MWLASASSGIRRIINPVVTWACKVGMYALVVLVLVVVADVIMRVMKIGVTGLNEIQVFMLVVITFLAVAYVGIIKRPPEY